MKPKLIATLAVTSLAALSLMAQASSAAPAKGGEKEKAEKGAANAPKNIAMPVFPGLKFGMSLEQIAKLNDKDLDTEYKKKFLAASPLILPRARGRCTSSGRPRWQPGP